MLLLLLLWLLLCFGRFPMGYQAGKELAQLHPTSATALAAVTFVCLQLGGWVFAAGFPEKYFPGVFDYAFFSHQVSELCCQQLRQLTVGAAMLQQYVCAVNTLNWVCIVSFTAAAV